ncbi:MAG: OmpA family protein [Bacteroidota bacterium]|nr:OmpA family protein [Bacteroidota bacterium]MDP4232283.1 OmpA family protein [Bacteroidota bacterium]MDP4241422.1 OmpA family protein [Bacteroidota bacterium]MDP4286754.1 OmpA family protein [Bacteroidota bacterium]
MRLPYSLAAPLNVPALICHALLMLVPLLIPYTSWGQNPQLPGINIEIPPPKKSAPAAPPAVFDRINMGPNINSEYSDLFPVLTPDETLMFFVRKGDPSNTGYANNPNDEDIWYSLRQSDGSWSKAEKLPGPLNTTNYDGVRAINTTATHLYLQNTYRADGTGGKGFSMSSKQPDGSWSFPEPLLIDDYYNDTSIAMMTISGDEKYMILSLKRKDGLGQHDLYLSRNIDGHLHWSRPELIAELSTPGDDISPFIAYDDRTIYFSTNGRGGIGDYDIFVARRQDESWMHWSNPRDLGEPVNTISFDAYFTIGARGDTAYFSSAHETSTRGFGKSDIWKLYLREDLRPGFHLPKGSEWDPNLSAKDLQGSQIRLDEVRFDVGSSSLKGESMAALGKVVELMKRLPGLAIEIQGHTDSQGDRERNMVLSQKRAEAVVTFLASRGVRRDRLGAKGFGPDRPIAPNETASGRALNRRVVIEVTRAAD